MEDKPFDISEFILKNERKDMIAMHFIDTFLDPTLLKIKMNDLGLNKTDWILESSLLNTAKSEMLYEVDKVTQTVPRENVYRITLKFKRPERVESTLLQMYGTSYYKMAVDKTKEFILESFKEPSILQAEAFVKKVVHTLINDYEEYIND